MLTMTFIANKCVYMGKENVLKSVNSASTITRKLEKEQTKPKISIRE